MSEKAGDVYVRIHFSSSGKEFKDEVKRDTDFREGGEAAGDQAGEGYRDAFGDKLKDALDDYEKHTQAKIKEDRKWTGQFKASMTRLEKDLDQFWTGQKNDINNKFRRPIGELFQDTERLSEKWHAIWARRIELGDSLQDARNLELRMESLGEQVENAAGWAAGLARGFDDITESSNRTGRSIDRNNNIFAKTGRIFDDVADGVGAAFGRGSRNNLLNFVGSFVRNSVKLLGLFPKLLGFLASWSSAFNDARDSGQNFFKAMSAGFAGTAEAAEGAAAGTAELAATGPAGLIAIAAAAGGVALALGPIAALISGIAGALTSLVASLSFAVIGALAPLAGLIAPVILGIGAIATGLIGMDDKAKKAFKEGIKPLTDGFKELGKAARAGFFSTFNIDAKGVNDVLERMAPLMRAVGAALGNVVTRFVNGFKSPAFDEFVKAMTVFVPNALESLGEIAQNVAGAIGNIFVDLIPSTNDFLSWLTGITEEFQQWTSSAAGRQKILDFLSDAQESAKAVGHFLGSVTKLLADIIGAGRKTGDSIFTDLTEQVEKFRDFISPKKLTPEPKTLSELAGVKGGIKPPTAAPPVLGPSPLEEWFKNAKDTADAIGRITRNLAKLFDKIDSPEARKTLRFFERLLEVLTSPVGSAGLLAILSPGGAAIGGILSLADAVGRLTRKLEKLNDATRIPDLNIDWSGAVHKVGGWVSDIVGKIKNYDWAGLGKSVATFLGNAIVNGMAGIPGQVIGMFSGIASDIVNAIGSIDIFPHVHWPDPPDWVKKAGGFVDRVVPGAAGGLFTGPTNMLIGEAGPEALVPLSRPLSQVDPAVRWLSALAQGKVGSNSITGRGGRSITTGPISIITPTEDPVAVAQQVVNRIAAASYI